MNNAASLIKLPDRGRLIVGGPDRATFLQGLISNDIDALKTSSMIYACLLSHNGRFLHDFFLTQDEHAIFMECEGGKRAQDLFLRLKKYCLRAEVTIDYEENIPVYAALPENATALLENIFQDPRHADMGVRLYHPPENMQDMSFAVYDKTRITLSIPDGSRDLILEKSTLLEHNIDQINGISWNKGCYIGQELTARTNYRATLKKRLCPLRFEEAAPPPMTELTDQQGKKVGQMRSSCENIGLALLRIETDFENCNFSRL